jgi:hypothetical protein
LLGKSPELDLLIFHWLSAERRPVITKTSLSPAQDCAERLCPAGQLQQNWAFRPYEFS